MANTDNLEQSDNVEDRRGERMSDSDRRGAEGAADLRDKLNPSGAISTLKGLIGMKGPGAPKGSLADQAGMNNFADGGEVGDDGYDEDDTQTNTTPGMGVLPTVQDTGSEYDQDQTGGQPGGGDMSPSTPGAAQSGGTQPSQLMQLVRAVHSYGMRMANQPQQQSFEDGGAVENAGSDTSQDQTPPPAQGQPQGAPPQAGAPQQGGPQNGLMKFIQGDRAMDPQVMAAIEHAVDPDGSMPGAARKAQAIQYAYQRGMEQTRDPREAMNMALGALQHNRKQFDMWRTAAAVKADQGDMGSSIQAANKAFEAPFGHNVHFAPVGNGSGGGARSFEDGGSTDNEDDDNLTTGAIPSSKPAPTYQQAGPFTDEEQSLNNREQALDRSGLGGAFGQAQHQKIAAARQQFAQQGPGPQDTGPSEDSPFSPTSLGADFRQAASGFMNRFGPSPAVTATVTDDQGNPTGQYSMSKDEYGNLLKQNAQFDNLVQQGPHSILNPANDMSQRGTGRNRMLDNGLTVDEQDRLNLTSAARNTLAISEPNSQRYQDAIDADNAMRKALGQPAKEDKTQQPQTPEEARWQQRENQLRTQASKIYANPNKSMGQEREKWIYDQLNKERAAEATRQGTMERTTYREGEHDRRSENYWGNRAQEAAQREGATRRGQILKDLIAQHSPSDDLEGFKTGLKKIGLDYDRDVLNAGRGQPQGGGQPQRAPSAGGAQPQAGGQSQGQAQGGTWLPKFKAGKPVWVNDLTGEERAVQ